jgi:GAF domain-containing protein
VSSDASKESIAAPVFGKEVKVPSFSSVVCMPLVVQGTTRGVLVLADKEIKTVSTQLRSFLELVIGQLGLHLENLYLKSRLYKR